MNILCLCYDTSTIFFPFNVKITLGGDEIIMLVHANPHKPLKKIKAPSTVTRLTAHLTCGRMWFETTEVHMYSTHHTKMSCGFVLPIAL